jgi:hypothetical protein
VADLLSLSSAGSTMEHGFLNLIGIVAFNDSTPDRARLSRL